MTVFRDILMGLFLVFLKRISSLKLVKFIHIRPIVFTTRDDFEHA